MAEAFATVQTTAQHHLRGSVDQTIRRRLFFAMMERKNRISLNAVGRDLRWLVEFRENAIQPYGSGGVLNFSPSDQDRELSIDVRGYKGTDAWHEKDYLMNRGDVAILQRYSKIIPRLNKTMRNQFCGEFYIDGNLTANANRLHGLASFMGDDGATVDADIIANPSDTYAGRSTALGNHGGSWTSALGTPPNATAATDWPFGNGDTEYDFMSPKLVNYASSSGWGTSSSTWEDNCERCMRHMKNWLTSTGGEEGMPDVHLLSIDMFTGFQNHFESDRRIIVPHKRAQDLGFDSTLNFEGVMVEQDFDVAAGEGFTVNFDQVELFSIDSVLFRSQGPTFDIRTSEYLFTVGYYGNLRWNPKHHGKFKSYA